MCVIDGTGAMDLLRKTLQHSHWGGLSTQYNVRMEEQKGCQPADLSEGGNIYKVIILDIISETD